MLPVSFHRLIVKALDFKPIGQVRQFVFDYLLDEHRVDTEALQVNLENYKRLEVEARAAVQRLAALDRLCEQGGRIAGTRRTIQSHRHVALRAASERADGDEARTELEVAHTAQALADAAAARERTRRQIEDWDRERNRILGMLQQQPGYQQLQQLQGGPRPRRGRARSRARRRHGGAPDLRDPDRRAGRPARRADARSAAPPPRPVRR